MGDNMGLRGWKSGLADPGVLGEFLTFLKDTNFSTYIFVCLST